MDYGTKADVLTLSQILKLEPFELLKTKMDDRDRQANGCQRARKSFILSFSHGLTIEI